MCSAAGRILLSMLAKEKEEKSYPAPRERNMVRVVVIRVGGILCKAVAGSWKNTGAADSKESMDSFKEGHPVFEN